MRGSTFHPRNHKTLERSYKMNIGYHTRLWHDNTRKITGGSFGGELNADTIARLASNYTVIIKPSGTAVFVDRSGREVYLYVTVDAATTVAGREALAAHYKRRCAEAQEAEARQAREDEELTEACANLTHEEILNRLKGTSE
jgi:hypothetical protein